ncbi:hypothetical protein F5R70_08115 [Campylobacter lari]|uniref:Glycosyl transferase n=1 Tax=Campylobacter lari TaxID=201 RepID=A0A698FVM2_CAMLA|nr:capsular polysaccharide synthesis protein [Campylobacter lari]ECW8955378.1 hypothetical protein [Campylobacter lari]MBT0794975.1 capsular polysaccharide synthesis protein [Campylobacter lari]
MIVNFIGKILYFFANIIPVKRIRKIIKAKIKWKYSHPYIANYLKLNYITPYYEKNNQYHLEPKAIFENEKIIWQFWYQGENEMPDIIKKCTQSVKRYMGEEYKIIILDKNTIKKYIDLPDFVVNKLENDFFGKKTTTFFSDLLRVALLSLYGGIWMDATIFLSAPINKDILSKKFFIFTRSKNKPEDYIEWVLFNRNYFSWDEGFQVNMLSSFLVAQKNSSEVSAIKDILLEYWKKEKTIRHYFIIQILFNILYDCKSADEYNSDIVPHLLQKFSDQNFDQKLWKSIKTKTSIHKLTYFKNIRKNSLIDIVLSHSYE